MRQLSEDDKTTATLILQEYGNKFGYHFRPHQGDLVFSPVNEELPANKNLPDMPFVLPISAWMKDFFIDARDTVSLPMDKTGFIFAGMLVAGAKNTHKNLKVDVVAQKDDKQTPALRFGSWNDMTMFFNSLTRKQDLTINPDGYAR